MYILRRYLNNLEPDDQVIFAQRCGTTIGYLRKAISKRSKFDAALAVAIERETKRVVRVEDLRPDVDWMIVRYPALTLDLFRQSVTLTPDAEERLAYELQVPDD